MSSADEDCIDTVAELLDRFDVHSEIDIHNKHSNKKYTYDIYTSNTTTTTTTTTASGGTTTKTTNITQDIKISKNKPKKVSPSGAAPVASTTTTSNVKSKKKSKKSSKKEKLKNASSINTKSVTPTTTLNDIKDVDNIKTPVHELLNGNDDKSRLYYDEKLPINSRSNNINDSLRWSNVLDNPEEEEKRLNIYKINRRKRYIDQRNRLLHLHTANAQNRGNTDSAISSMSSNG